MVAITVHLSHPSVREELSWICMVMQAEQVCVEALAAAACLATDDPGWESFQPLTTAQRPCVRFDSSSANEAGSSSHFGTYVCEWAAV